MRELIITLYEEWSCGKKYNYSLKVTYSAITLKYSLARHFMILTHVTATGLCQNTPITLHCTLSVQQN